MKHYRLKKDLPTFKAGQTFHTDAQGNLWLDEGQGPSNHWLAEVMAYHHRTIEHFPNILEDWFDEIVVPDPGYTVAMIQKLENSVKELDERLKTVEEITERLLREDRAQAPDNDVGTCSTLDEPGIPQRERFERMKQILRDWIEGSGVDQIQIFIHTEPDGRRGVKFADMTHKGYGCLTLIGWPTTGLKDGAVYTPDELLITGEAGKE